MDQPVTAISDEADSTEVETHTYKVMLQNGDSRWSGTDAQASLILHGDKRASDELLFRGELKKSGSLTEDQFVVPFVGNIIQITVKHNGQGWNSAWELCRATVEDENLHRSWTFEQIGWLNSENKNSVTLRPMGIVGAGALASRRRSSIFHGCQLDGDEDEAKVVTVKFETYCYFRDCTTLYLVGSSPALGSWDVNRALRMERISSFDGSWKGDWLAEVELDDVENLEYKYVCIDDSSGKRLWESGKHTELHIKGKDPIVNVKDKLATPSRSATKLLSQKLKMPSPVKMMPIEEAKAIQIAEEKLVPMRRVQELEAQLQAVRTSARQRERELASLRAKTMLSPTVTKRSSNEAVVAEVRSSISDLRSQIESIRKSVDVPISNLFGQVDGVRITLSDIVESATSEVENYKQRAIRWEEELNRTRIALQEAQQHQKIETVEGSQTEQDEELFEEVQELRKTVENLQSQQLEVETLLRKKEQQKNEAEERYKREFQERKRLFNTVQELKGNIRVFCRVRPPRCLDSSCAAQMGALENGECRKLEVNSKAFEFDRVFGGDDSQEKVYGETAAVITSVLDGYNACVFAYGQTGSGKTYTMNGSNDDPGVNYRALQDLFRLKKARSDSFDVKIHVSMLEIYNETLRDLLVNDRNSTMFSKLEIKKGHDGVYIPDLTTIECESAEHVWKIMSKGASSRSSGATAMNERSSRSHLIVSVRTECTSVLTGERSVGNLHLVDLAGSERVSKSQAKGDRLREAAHINKSLAALGDVFMSILARNPHVPYRNSKLTYLLQESIGGNSKTIMFVNISPEEDNQSESVCSLHFASRVSKVELGAASRKADGVELARVAKELQDKEAQRKSLDDKLSQLQREALQWEREKKMLFDSKQEETSKREAAESANQRTRHELEAAERLRQDLERRLHDAEQQAKGAEHAVRETERQREDAERRARDAEKVFKDISNSTPTAKEDDRWVRPKLTETLGRADESRPRRGSSNQDVKVDEKVRNLRYDVPNRASAEISREEAGSSSTPAVRTGRSVHFAPTVSTTSEPAAKSKLPAKSTGGAKRIVYAFGTRVDLGGSSGGGGDEENTVSSHGSGHAFSNAKKQPVASFSRPAQRVIAGNTPVGKALRPRKF